MALSIGSSLPRARRSPDLVIEQLPDELLVYDEGRKQAHCLGPAAALVWNRCDGRTTVGEAAAALEAAGIAKAREGAALVGKALDELSAASLLAEDKPYVPGSISRRDALRFAAIAGGAALVTTVAARPAWACGSFRNQPCCPDGTCKGTLTCNAKSGKCK